MKDYESPHGGEKTDSSNCRTCTDFKTWSKQQKKAFSTSLLTNTRMEDTASHNDECPLDRSQLGRSTWGLLHTIGASYSENPTDQEKTDVTNFFHILSRIYPCEYCAKDFRKQIEKCPVDASSQRGLSQWLCKMHNIVNNKLGKPLFDCSKVDERWKDGWKDGSCDGDM